MISKRSKRQLAFGLLTAAGLVTVSAAPTLAKARQTTTAPIMSMVGEVEKSAAFTMAGKTILRAAPSTVWKVLVSTAGLEAMTGLKFGANDRNKLLTGLGDSLVGTRDDAPGRLVVTGFDADHELRLAWEPDDGQAPRSMRFVLALAGERTIVNFAFRHVDTQPDADQAAAAARQRLMQAADEFTKLVRQSTKRHGQPPS